MQLAVAPIPRALQHHHSHPLSSNYLCKRTLQAHRISRLHFLPDDACQLLKHLLSHLSPASLLKLQGSGMSPLSRRPAQTVSLMLWIRTNEGILKAMLQFPSCCSPSYRRRSSLKFGASVPPQLFRYNLIHSARDLSDINNDGRLTRDGFAVAMHLIQGKLSGKEIPTVLPPTLVPPSMRLNGPTSPFAAVPPQPSEAMRDLLWDDSPPTSIVNIQPQHNVPQHQATGIAPPSVSPPPASRAPQFPQDPFTTATRDCTSLHFLLSSGCLIHAFHLSIPQGSSWR